MKEIIGKSEVTVSSTAIGDMDTTIWEFAKKEDEKKCVWWNLLDWIPKYFSVK